MYVPVAAGLHADQLSSAVVAEVGYGAAFLSGKDPAARQTEVRHDPVHGLSDAQAVMIVADRCELFLRGPFSIHFSGESSKILYLQ